MTFGNTPTTKGEMVKILKRFGIRKGDTSDGRTVGIKHMKYEDICVLFAELEEKLKNHEFRENAPHSTGDAEYFYFSIMNDALNAVFEG